MIAIKTLVYDEKYLTIGEFKKALADNYGRGLTEAEAQKATSSVVAELMAKGKNVSEKQIEDIYNFCIVRVF